MCWWGNHLFVIFAVLDVSLAVNLCINCSFLHLLQKRTPLASHNFTISQGPDLAGVRSAGPSKHCLWAMADLGFFKGTSAEGTRIEVPREWVWGGVFSFSLGEFFKFSSDESRNEISKIRNNVDFWYFCRYLVLANPVIRVVVCSMLNKCQCGSVIKYRNEE